MSDTYKVHDAAKIVSTERIIPQFIDQSLASNTSLVNKWVTEPFPEYVYVEEVRRTFDDGETDSVRVQEKCQPTAVQYMYQVNEKGIKDGLFIAYLEDGRLHWISMYKDGKSVEHHCIVQECADSIQLRKLWQNNPLIFWRCEKTPQNGLGIDTHFQDGKPFEQEVYCRKDGRDLWREKVAEPSREVATRAKYTSTYVSPTEKK